MERKLIKSGIPGLDSVLGGGFLESSIVTVSGPTGCGKSTLATQFLYNGAVQENQPGLHISIEESRTDFLFHNASFKWDFQVLEGERKFILLDYPIHEVDQIVTQTNAIQEIIATTGVRRVVIDSIMPIALFFNSEDERKKGFLKFIENLRRWRTTTLIVSEDVSGSGSEPAPSTGYGIETFTDGWINLFYKYDNQKMERNRYLEVLKMKGMTHSAKSYPTKIDENGMSIVVPESVKIALDPLRRPSVLPPVQRPMAKTTKAPAKAEEGSARIAAAKKKLFRK
jgi:circadian clock protein KaiC